MEWAKLRRRQLRWLRNDGTLLELGGTTPPPISALPHVSPILSHAGWLGCRASAFPSCFYSLWSLLHSALFSVPCSKGIFEHIWDVWIPTRHIIQSPLCSPSYQRLSSLWSAAVQQATHVVCPWMTLACFAWPSISLWGRMSWCNLRNGWKCTCTGSVTAWFLVCLGVNHVHFWELSSINRPKPILQPKVF